MCACVCLSVAHSIACMTYESHFTRDYCIIIYHKGVYHFSIFIVCEMSNKDFKLRTDFGPVHVFSGNGYESNSSVINFPIKMLIYLIESHIFVNVLRAHIHIAWAGKNENKRMCSPNLLPDGWNKLWHPNVTDRQTRTSERQRGTHEFWQRNSLCV